MLVTGSVGSLRFGNEPGPRSIQGVQRGTAGDEAGDRAGDKLEVAGGVHPGDEVPTTCV